MPEPEPIPDQATLALRAVSGERGAFGALYERHVDGVFHYVHFRVGDVDVAADVTQDIFVRAFRGISRLRNPERFVPWLMRIAHNLVQNHRREATRRRERWTAPLDDDTPEIAVPDTAPELETKLAAEKVARAAKGLTDDQQQVIALRFVAGLTLAETAEILGRSDDAVKKLQRRALSSLRRLLDEDMPI
jgi:RNA polymerase sigma-70 factor, ECF subfamily